MTEPLAAASPSAAPAPLRLWREALEIGRTVVAALLIAVVVRSFVFQPYTIPSSSMEPGLVTGDYIVVSRFAFGWSRASLPFNPPLPDGRVFGAPARRGEVVVFRHPARPEETWIKRVIGLPGDRVEVRGGQVFVNGAALPQAAGRITRDHDAPWRTVREVDETGADGRRYRLYDGGPGLAGDDAGVFLVPPGAYFVMGDNRDNSLDSRWSAEVGVGLLPEEMIVGRAAFVLASWRPDASVLKPWTWLELQTDRFLRPIR
jgi:signal peptidase I